jgi:hypothetical protein
VAKPALPETVLTSKDGKTKINLAGAIENGKPYFVMGVRESPGNGAPHLILLQDKNCNVMRPSETSVTEIWEAWGGWRITVSWTKSYYQDGQLVKQEKGGWSTPWHIFRAQIKDPSEIPGIWKDFNSKPFEGIREVMSSFEPPPEIPFIPADWNLITHATTDAGNNQLVTAPFVTGLGTDQNNNLTFQQRDRTACESAPPTPSLASLLATQLIATIPSKTGLTWRWAEWFPDAPKTETRPGTPATTETRPDGTRIETFTDGIRVKTFPNGTRVETHPDGTTVTTFSRGNTTERRPDGTVISTYLDSTRVSFPDGSYVDAGPDGKIYFGDPDPPQPTQPASPPSQVEPDVPGLEDSDNALPVDQVM